MMRNILAGAVFAAVAADSAWAQDAVTLQLKWVTQAQFAGYYVAEAKGFYDEENLDVTILPGGPDIAPEQVIAGGGADVITTWMPAALAARERGVPLVNIAQPFKNQGLSFVCRKDQGVESTADFPGKTLGVLGYGRLGHIVAQYGKAFRMRVLADNHNLHKYQSAAESLGVQLVPLETLLAEADFLSLHVPLTDETRAMIGPDQLGRMKQGAILINTSRGAVLDEKALCCALQEGWIGGAGLDVFEKEPLPEDSCLRFASNVVLTPHIAARAVESERVVGLYAARVVLEALGLE